MYVGYVCRLCMYDIVCMYLCRYVTLYVRIYLTISIAYVLKPQKEAVKHKNTVTFDQRYIHVSLT